MSSPTSWRGVLFSLSPCGPPLWSPPCYPNLSRTHVAKTGGSFPLARWRACSFFILSVKRGKTLPSALIWTPSGHQKGSGSPLNKDFEDFPFGHPKDAASGKPGWLKACSYRAFKPLPPRALRLLQLNSIEVAITP